MKIKLFILLLALLCGSIVLVNPAQITEPKIINESNLPMMKLDKVNKGVVLIDDVHDNDYTPNDVNRVADDLGSRGFYPVYASDFSNWKDALSNAHYLVLSAPHSDLSTQDILDLKEWFNNGSRNLIVSSRGDFSSISYDSMNNMLAELGATSKIQDDNVYTTDPSVFNPWYVRTNNFDSGTYATLFDGVDVIDLFSPSSIFAGASATVLAFAEAQAYQSNEGGDPPAHVYDDTDDGTGGDVIPLVVYEEVTVGADDDRIFLTGATMHSDFDYGDSDAQDHILFGNIFEYFGIETINSGEDLTINLPDILPPEVKITFPHDGAVLKGTINVTLDVFDFFDIASYDFLVNDVSQSTSPFYLWDTSTFSNGDYKLEVKVTDTSGNVGTITANYKIDQAFTPSLDTDVKVMTYNIKESGIYEEWIDVYKEENPDIAILVETGDFDDNSNELLNEYKAQLNSYFFDEMPYNVYTLQDIDTPWNGISLLSRFDITTSDKKSIVTMDDGSTYEAPLPFLYAKLSVFDEEVNLLGSHLTCCTDGKDNRLKEMEGALNFFDSLGAVPVIFLGDMNAQSPDDFANPADASLGVEPISMVLDSTNAKASTKHQFTDAFIELNPGNPGYSYGGYSRIDYIFVNQYFTGKLVSSTTGDTPTASSGSDHVPVDVVIDFSGGLNEPTSTDDTEGSSEAPGLNGFNYFIAVMSIGTLTIIHKKKK